MRILIFNVLIFLSGIVSACTTFSLSGENSFRENSYDANYNLQEYVVSHVDFLKNSVPEEAIVATAKYPETVVCAED